MKQGKAEGRGGSHRDQFSYSFERGSAHSHHARILAFTFAACFLGSVGALLVRNRPDLITPLNIAHVQTCYERTDEQDPETVSLM
jgi:hypothetical protein